MREFESFEGVGFVAYVHRDAMAAADEPGVIRFHFGRFGWRELRLEGRGGGIPEE